MDRQEALRTFTTGENFHLQHYLGAHQDEVDGQSGYTISCNGAPECSECASDWRLYRLV